MNIRVIGLPPDAAPSPVTHSIVFDRIDYEKEEVVYRYLPSRTVLRTARIEGIPQGTILISEDAHRLQYIHTVEDGTDVYRYVESVGNVTARIIRNDNFVDEVLEQAPEAYDGDAAAEAIAIQYVRDLEWIRDRTIAKLGELEKIIGPHSDVFHDFVVGAKQEITERARKPNGL